MTPHRMGRWRWAGVQLRMIYRVQKSDLGRVGNCWMKGRLLVDDLVVPIAHAGDCFFNYQLIESGSTRGERWVNAEGKSIYRLCQGAEFGAYAMSTPHDEQPTDEEWAALMAGESTTFSNHIEVAPALAQAEAASVRELEGILDAAIASAKADMQ